MILTNVVAIFLWCLFCPEVKTVVEESKSRRKSNVLSNLNGRPHVVNNSSENENTFPINTFVPGDITYADAVKPAVKFLFVYSFLV